MKRVLLTAIFTAATLSAADQYEMIIHQKGSKTNYLTTAVDSITFVKKGGGTVTPAMITIPAGTFMYQNKESKAVASFAMSKYKITQKEYLAIMGINPSEFAGDVNRPVENVTWYDAVLYCNARSKAEGKDTLYSYSSKTGTNPTTSLEGLVIDSSKNGYSIPSEVQWEYALRGGTTTAYFWGDSEASAGIYSWFYENSGFETHPVGGKQPNPFGLYDMTGNVNEWCESWRYPSSDNYERAVRGGSWYTHAALLSSWYRVYHNCNTRLGTIGFRVVLRSR